MRGQSPKEEELTPEDRGLMVSFRNAKTGLVESKNPYILRVIGEGSNKTQLWERPAGSGNLWVHSYGGEPAGRWDVKQPEGKRWLADAKHIEWAAPLTEDQKLVKKMTDTEAENQALKAEIAAIKAEQAPKVKADSKAPKEV